MTDISNGFNKCQSLVALPESLFSDCPNIKYAGCIFRDCYNLSTVPVSIFDNNRNLTDINRAFLSCTSLKGESPYTMIGGKKYHLYERNDAPDYFSPIINMDELFHYSYSNLNDKDSIPEICR